jgi:uncharacterized protein (TIGR03663 family)
LSQSFKYLILFLVILIAGGVFRLVSPDLRPMHTDESVNAHKFGILLETGEYRYDKTEYHGPALYYFTLPLAWLKGQKSYQSLDESTLRMVPALFGLLFMALLLLLIQEWKWDLILVTGGLLAIAPALVFYNRYFIHESLLAFFSFTFIFSGFKYLKYRKIAWLILAGVFAGFMHATKETCVINYAVALLSLIIVLFIQRRSRDVRREKHNRIPVIHFLVVVASAIVISVLFFSSFFSNWQGIADSVTTYAVYFDRAGVDDAHIHPWYFYLSLLISAESIHGSFGTEVFLVITSIAGFVLLLFRKNRDWSENFLLFIGFYSLLLLLIYSAMPYKTPWNILQFYPGFLFLSGYTFIRILQFRSVRWLQIVMLVLFVSGCVHWGWTGYQYNFRNSSEPGNPYVYAHTVADVVEITGEIDQIGVVHPDGYDVAVEVVFPGHDYWPLPWYLRKFSNTGYYSEVDTSSLAAPIIIIHESVEKQLVRKLYELPGPGERYLYVPLSGEYLELRPGVEMRIYVRNDVWDIINRPDESI